MFLKFMGFLMIVNFMQLYVLFSLALFFSFLSNVCNTFLFWLKHLFSDRVLPYIMYFSSELMNKGYLVFPENLFLKLPRLTSVFIESC